MIVGGVGESCEVSERGQECKDRSTEDDINQVTYMYLLTGFNPHLTSFEYNK